MPPDHVRRGAYLCISTPSDVAAALAAPVPAIVERFRLQNEFFGRDGHPADAVAFLRRVESAAGDMADDGVCEAAAIVHAASNDDASVRRSAPRSSDVCLVWRACAG